MENDAEIKQEEPALVNSVSEEEENKHDSVDGWNDDNALVSIGGTEKTPTSSGPCHDNVGTKSTDDDDNLTNHELTLNEPVQRKNAQNMNLTEDSKKIVHDGSGIGKTLKDAVGNHVSTSASETADTYQINGQNTTENSSLDVKEGNNPSSAMRTSRLGGNMRKGLDLLRYRHSNRRSQSKPFAEEDYDHPASCVTVRFIDPSSSNINPTHPAVDTGKTSPTVPTMYQEVDQNQQRKKGRSWLNLQSNNNNTTDKDINTDQNNSKAYSSQQPYPPTNRQVPYTPAQNKNIYQRLKSIFQSHYDSTLFSVPYHNPRTQTTETIDSIPVRSFLASSEEESQRNQYRMLTTDDDITSPSEWHTTPHCHVYIAPCASMEHYRARVRPALRAFVSQVEGAGSGNANAAIDAASRNLKKKKAGDQGSDNFGHPNSVGMAAAAASDVSNSGSRQYVIVYVPLLGDMERGGKGGGEYGIDDDIGMSSIGNNNGRMLGFKDRFGAGRKNNNNKKSNKPSDYAMMEDTIGSSYHSDDLGSFSLGPSSLPTQVEEIHKKFISDFPNGRTCVLSTLIDRSSSRVSFPSDISTKMPAGPLQNQEWKAFQQALADAIVCGFEERVLRYSDELRRLNKLRTNAMESWSSTIASSYNHSNDNISSENFENESVVETDNENIQNKTNDDKPRIDLDSHHSQLDESTSNKSVSKNDNFGFKQVGQYMLVKEGLAFTYEQIQLPFEALREYEELDAMLPEAEYDEWISGNSKNNDMDSINTLNNNKCNAEHVTALSGDVIQFRRIIRSYNNSEKRENSPLLFFYLIKQYLFSRKTHLLFMMGQPLKVLQLFTEFVNFNFHFRSKLIHLTKDDGDKHYLKASLEAWVVSTCWDVKCEFDGYYTSWHSCNGKSDDSSNLKKMIQMDVDHLSSDSEVLLKEDESDAACTLSVILGFARLRFLSLGDLVLGHENIIRRAKADRPPDLLHPWGPWANPIGSIDSTDSASCENETITSSPYREVSEKGRNVIQAIITVDDSLGPWLQSTFQSSLNFEDKYLELTDAMIKLNTCLKRHRSAGRLQAEQAEIYALREDYKRAASTLLPAIEWCSDDRWGRVYSWRLFRLACFQRVSVTSKTYFNTLSRCFGPILNEVMPPKTSELLHNDIISVISSPDISNHKLSLTPFLELDLIIERTLLGRESEPLGFIKKKMTKHICAVGDDVVPVLTIRSHLPEKIQVESIKVFLVRLDDYKSFCSENNAEFVEENHASHTLKLDSPLTILPGNNVFKFQLTPMTVGQYVLACAFIQWKNANFFYYCHKARRPVPSIQVIPCDHTQSIELNPLFLIPGHEQNVRLVFNAGSDIVNGGVVQLICSHGLMVKPDGKDSEGWKDSCTKEIEACDPGSTRVLAVTVKSNPSRKLSDTQEQSLKQEDDEDYVQMMQAKVTTSYHHKLYGQLMNGCDKSDQSPPMTTALRAMVTTLDRPALTVRSTDAFFYAEDSVIVSAAVHCNTPVPFFLKEWSVSFSTLLSLDEDGDLNKNLFKHAVSEGEVLFFGFRCSLTDYDSSPDTFVNDSPTLNIVLEDDSRKTFRQVLPLDLSSLYKQVKREDECKNMNVAYAKLKANLSEGVVDSPVHFTYEVDISMLTMIKRRLSSLSSTKLPVQQDINPIKFNIFCETSEWILGGKVQGFIERGNGQRTFKLSFIGIPTVPGVLKQFPELNLQYTSKKNRNNVGYHPNITVNSTHPDSFKSMAYKNHVSLACTSNTR